MQNWKMRVYNKYVSSLFGKTHKSDKREYILQNRYFKKNYLKFMPKDKTCKILDLGCGMGHMYYACKENGYLNYTGVDISVENISFIEERWGDKPNVKQADMFQFLREKECQFDVVIFNDVIEHLNKEEIFEVMDGTWKILSNGGVLFIKTNNMANPFVNTSGRYICMDHEIGFTEKSMEQLLITTGYSKFKIIGTNIYVVCPIIDQIAYVLSKLINIVLFLCSTLYGRTGIRIFEKDILAIAYKDYDEE